MSKYYTMSSDDALRYLKARDEGQELGLDDVVRTSGAGELAEAAPIKELEAKLRQMKKRFPAHLKSRDPAGGKFESQACEVVHRCFEGFEPAALADHDFWTWLAVARMADIVEWRFGARGQCAKPANYGIGSRTENLFFRLWLRADMAKDSGLADSYLLAKSGDQDLWRSHILRQGYANVRAVAKALLKLQAGMLKAKKLASGDDENGVRMLAKLLKRLRANVDFQFLGAKEMEDLVVEMSAGLQTTKA